MRINDVSKPDWLSGATASTTLNTSAISELGFMSCGISVKTSGTVNGSFKVQESDFGVDELNPPASGEWSDYPSSSQVSAALIKWDIAPLGSKWVRVLFTDSGGTTGTWSAAITLRGRP